MKRVQWKLPFIKSSLMKPRLFNLDVNKVKSFRFRNSVIPPFMVGRRLRVYNGAWFLVQTINFDMVGTKFGEYSLTKRFDKQQQSRFKKKKAKKK